MDVMRIIKKMPDLLKKYRLALVVLLIGLLLMVFPMGKGTDDAILREEIIVETKTNEITQQELEQIISEIDGVGRVKVLLTRAAGERKVFQVDTDISQSDANSKESGKTVVLTDDNRAETALITQTIGPEYLGAVVVCQGADDPVVQWSVTDAVAKATGMGVNRISVLKMK